MADQQSDRSGIDTTVVTAALIATQSAAIARVRARVAALVQRQWVAQPDYRSPDRFVAAVVPIVTAGQQQVAAITAAYLSQMYARLTGASVKTIGVPPDVVTGLRAGVTPAQVYQRPFHLVWRDLADAQAARDAHYEWSAPTSDEPQRPPLPPPDYVDRAIEHGLERAQKLAATDLQLAKQHAALHVMGHQTNVTGYRRVLEGAYSCGLCIVVSTRRYHKSELLPIHPGCDCGIEPIVGQSGPVVASMARDADGRLVPVGQLPDVHQRIAETFGRDSAAARAIGAAGSSGKPINYRDVIITHDHGELGPVLAVRGQSFTGPTDIAKHVTPKRATTS